MACENSSRSKYYPIAIKFSGIFPAYMTTQVLIDFGPDQSSIRLQGNLLNVFLYLMLATASMSHRQVTAPKITGNGLLDNFSLSIFSRKTKVTTELPCDPAIAQKLIHSSGM